MSLLQSLKLLQPERTNAAGRYCPRQFKQIKIAMIPRTIKLFSLVALLGSYPDLLSSAEPNPTTGGRSNGYVWQILSSREKSVYLHGIRDQLIEDGAYCYIEGSKPPATVCGEIDRMVNAMEGLDFTVLTTAIDSEYRDEKLRPIAVHDMMEFVLYKLRRVRTEEESDRLLKNLIRNATPKGQK